MAVVIKVLNLDKVISKYDALWSVDTMPVIKAATEKVQKTAKDLAPVDTGYLRGNIRRKMFPAIKAGMVYNSVEYAIYQEFGTVKMRASPFMRPALNINRVGIHQMIRGYIKAKLDNPNATYQFTPNRSEAVGRNFTYTKTSGGRIKKQANTSGKRIRRNTLIK